MLGYFISLKAIHKEERHLKKGFVVIHKVEGVKQKMI